MEIELSRGDIRNIGFQRYLMKYWRTLIWPFSIMAVTAILLAVGGTTLVLSKAILSVLRVAAMTSFAAWSIVYILWYISATRAGNELANEWMGVKEHEKPLKLVISETKTG